MEKSKSLIATLGVISLAAVPSLAQVYVVGSGSQLGTMNPTSGAFTSVATLSGATSQLSGMTFRGDGTLYGVAGVDGLDSSLYRVNPATGATTFWGNIGVPLVSLAARSDGTLFGYATTFDANNVPIASTLYRINPAVESTATPVGPLGIATLDGLGFDAAGNLYTSLSSTGVLYQVNTSTGAASAIGSGLGTTDLSAFSLSGGTLYAFAADRTVRTVNTGTGAGGSPVSYSFGAGAPLDFVTAAASVVPEPGALPLALLGLSAVSGRYLRGRRRQACSGPCGS